jgi:hypothetical protein
MEPYLENGIMVEKSGLVCDIYKLGFVNFVVYSIEFYTWQYSYLKRMGKMSASN